MARWRGSDRRFVRRVRARRLAAWRPVVALVLVAALMTGAVWLVGWSQVLAVKGVQVAGAGEVVTDDRIREVAAVPEGEPLARVDLDRIRSRVESLAAVREADVTREWPDRVRVSIDERRVIALVRIGQTVRGMDAEGVAFRTYRGDPPAMPMVETEGSVSGDALREAAAVVAAMPGDLAGQVRAVEVATVDAITLRLADDRLVRWGSADGSEEKAAVLAVLLQQDARGYDVSAPGTPTTCDEPGCL